MGTAVQIGDKHRVDWNTSQTCPVFVVSDSSVYFTVVRVCMVLPGTTVTSGSSLQ